MGQVNPNLGYRLKYFRQNAGLSQLELEILIESAPGSLSRIESGINNPTKETIIKIAKVLKLSRTQIAYLIGHLVNPATQEEIDSAISQIHNYYNSKGVLSYLLDDRSRVIYVSKDFIKMLKLTEQQHQRALGNSIIELAYDQMYGIRTKLDPEEYNKIMYELLSRTYFEMGFMQDDKVAQKVFDYIDQHDYLRSLWDKVKRDKKEAIYFSSLESRKVVFRIRGIKIPMYFSNEHMVNHERFFIVEYIPTNKIIRLLNKVI